MREGETISDIVAEMRECAIAADSAIWGDERIAGLVENAKKQQIAYCDRLDAAWKRERDALTSQPRTWEECVQRSKEAWKDVF